MSSSPFSRYAAGRFSDILASSPSFERHRRLIRLKAAEEYWSLIHTRDERQVVEAKYAGDLPLPSVEYPDPLDFTDDTSSIVKKRGLIIRTDYANDDSFSRFVEIVTKSELEGIEGLFQDEEPTEGGPSGADGDQESDDDDEDDDEQTPVEQPDLESFIVIDPSVPSSPYQHLRQGLTNAPNIHLLRLFNDVDVIPCHPLPEHQKKGSKGAGSRIIDSFGLHEVYEGRLIWVYDSTSNTDGCVRLISSKATSYGTATGDSWRARGSSIWELQVNLDAGTMKIDFGGEDRYTPAERQRNVQTI